MNLQALFKHLTEATAIVEDAIASGEGAAPAEKPAKKANKPAPPPATIEDVRAALVSLIETLGPGAGNEAAREILAPFGTKKASGLAAEHFDAVLKAIREFRPADQDDPTA